MTTGTEKGAARRAGRPADTTLTRARQRLLAAMIRNPQGNIVLWAREIGRAKSTASELMTALVRDGYVIEEKSGSLWSRFRPAPDLLQAADRCPCCGRRMEKSDAAG